MLRCFLKGIPVDGLNDLQRLEWPWISHDHLYLCPFNPLDFFNVSVAPMVRDTVSSDARNPEDHSPHGKKQAIYGRRQKHFKIFLYLYWKRLE